MSKTTKDNEFIPSLMQIKYLEAFILTEDNINVSKLTKQIGIDRTTVWKWEQDDDYNKWFSEQTVKAFIRSLPKVHKGIETRAMKKYLDAKLYLQRFDEDFREKQDIKGEFKIKLSEKLKKMSDEELDKIISEDKENDKK